MSTANRKALSQLRAMASRPAVADLMEQVAMDAEAIRETMAVLHSAPFRIQIDHEASFILIAMRSPEKLK